MRAVLVGLLLVLALPTSAFAAPAPSPEIAREAVAADPLAPPSLPAPSGLAFDGEGNLWVTDYAGDRVLRFAPDGTLLTQWGSSGSSPGQFSGPFGIAVDGSSVYVVDQLNNRLQKLSTDGVPLASWGAAGAGTGQFRTPFGIVIGSGGLFIADFGNDRVQQLGFDGQPVRTWGRSGSGDGQFTRPAGIAVDRDGNLYVSDHFNARVEKFSPSGRFLGQLGPGPTSAPVPGAVAALGPSDPVLTRPEGLAVDRDGSVYVADYGRGRILKLSADGRLLAAWGSQGQGSGELMGPKAVALDAVGRVYAADTGNGRIMRFASDGSFDTAWNLPSAASGPVTPTPVATATSSPPVGASPTP